jgi:hypothetical protein
MQDEGLATSRLRTIRKGGITHVALERRSGYVLLCRPNGIPGEVGLFGWSRDARSFALWPSSCPLCAEALDTVTRAETRFGDRAPQPRLRVIARS